MYSTLRRKFILSYLRYSSPVEHRVTCCMPVIHQEITYCTTAKEQEDCDSVNSGKEQENSSTVSTATEEENYSIASTAKRIGFTKKDQRMLKKLEPEQPLNPKFLSTAIMGLPNAGKSTLANKLAGWKFVPVSNKVHTSRRKAVGVLTDNNTQIEFMDTPGLITTRKAKKHLLEESLLVDPHMTVFNADLIIVVVDISKVWDRCAIDLELLKVLYLHRNKKSVLVMNKVDALKNKPDLLQSTRILTEGIVGGNQFSQKKQKKPFSVQTYLNEKSDNPLKDPGVGPRSNFDGIPAFSGEQIEEFKTDWEAYNKALLNIRRAACDRQGYPGFDCVFMVSALTGDGVWELKQYILNEAQPGPWKHHHTLITDQDPMQLARECIKEKLLDNLDRELPYQLHVNVTIWDEDPDSNILRTGFDIVCPTTRHIRAVLGKEGEKISKITQEAKEALMNVFQRDLSLKMRVVKKGQVEDS